MPKYSLIKSNFLETYCKNKYALCVIFFTFGVIMLLYYISSTKNQTKLIENYTQSELIEITNKMDQVDTTTEEQTMDLSALLSMDLSGVIKRLFGSRCLAGCMSPNNTNRKDSMCKTSVKPYGTLLECPWRCNMNEYNKQKKYDIIFNQEMSTNGVKTCSVDNEDIDCGGCVPLRVFS
jgi:hypothetical protein